MKIKQVYKNQEVLSKIQELSDSKHAENLSVTTHSTDEYSDGFEYLKLVFEDVTKPLPVLEFVIEIYCGNFRIYSRYKRKWENDFRFNSIIKKQAYSVYLTKAHDVVSYIEGEIDYLLTEGLPKFNSFQEKWLQSLESGEYKQTTNRLCVVDKNTNESHCCLGVACDLYNAQQKRNKKKQLKVIIDTKNRKTFEGETFYLPEKVGTKLCVRLDDAAMFNINKDNYGIPFTRLNDSHNLTFEEIAYYARNNATSLFTNLVKRRLPQTPTAN